MDTNRIKRFATEARNILKAGIAAKITSLGFDKQGDVAEENKPQLMQGGSLWKGQIQTEGFFHQWMSLYSRIRQIGIKEVYEEAAYTWFNRLCAIRILQKNHLCQSVLAYADEARTPVIVDEARQGRLPQMSEEDRKRLMEYLDDDTKVTEQFAILVTAWCHDNPIMQQCFGGIADYTEMLLPNNILAEGGFVDLLNHTDFITNEDFHSPELIGWLYQFYISERKDEVFAKKGKFEADEIPAATQIFTPNWIVKYMVQNTIGRIYLDNNPYETQVQKKWKYLVGGAVSHCTINNNTENLCCGETPQLLEKSSETLCGETPHLLYDELTDLKVADLACGSGHILNECFDLLYDLYIIEGYSRAEAIENIFRHNLTGIDLDTRAKQLAMFSLLLKACQKDNAFADGHCLPNVLDMAGVVPNMNEEELQDACLQFMGGYEDVAGDMLEQNFKLLRYAETLGSIMEFNNDKDYLAMLRYHYEDWTEGGIDNCPDNIKALLPGIRIMLALTEKYHALVMNPPYMGGGNMNAVLSKYVKDNYAEGKADLATVFVQMMAERTLKNGSYAFIIPPSWMFLSTFEKLRKNIIENNSIQSLLHLSRGVFGADFGASSAVIQNAANKEARGTYFRLVERTFQEFEQSHLRMLFEQTLANHDFKYRFKDYTKDVTELPYSEDGNRIYYPNVSQQDFEKIPGCPIGYWVSEEIANSFNSPLFCSYYFAGHGLLSGHDKDMIRVWDEIDYKKINFNSETESDFHKSNALYVPMAKGGDFRKWYGNLYYLAKYDEDTIEHMRVFPKFTLQNRDRYFLQGNTWTEICSSNFGVRLLPKGCIFNHKGPTAFATNTEETHKLLGFMSSKVFKYYIDLINPTISCSAGTINKIPIKNNSKWNALLVALNISISKQDWDAHETSWDFQRNELLAIGGAVSHCTNNKSLNERLCGETPQLLEKSSKTLCGETPHLLLKDLVEAYKQKWEHKFMQLHENEEELNRQFIHIYGLEDELTPDVPLDEITILQQGEISIEDQ